MRDDTGKDGGKGSNLMTARQWWNERQCKQGEGRVEDSTDRARAGPGAILEIHGCRWRQCQQGKGTDIGNAGEGEDRPRDNTCGVRADP